MRFTFPKLSEVEDGVSVPCVVPTPVPLRGMLRLGFDTLLVTAIEPLIAPSAFGEKVAVNCLVPPDARVNGVVTAARVNPLPVMVTPETVTDPLPLLVTVTV